ncbi:DUF596 domain-containing protein [Erwinia sorbitola]|uniref:DUF596 domain-containing protein n=1 Tax=Erwinia sorbitola TaxID=2681984 RepID=A0A6I6F562_9GAMM|nr:DUF596 domain-containing protein [Erwinia sorbitola]MTD27494.1 DUF596 domain-containing protein [Erwinia sorbitola]QGU89030.1 DUF596 domain-containing protein [Erwinia sorbitola]
MNRESIYNSVLASARGLSLGAVWQHIEVECRSIPDNSALRKELFFGLLQQLLTTGAARLACDGVYLSGTVEQQLEQLAAAWPQPGSDDELDDLDETGFWFLAKAPAGLVWITPEGQEIWT